MKSIVPVGILSVGVLLLVLGLLWTFLFPATRTWTDEKSRRMTELQNNAHKLLYLSEAAKTRPQPGGPTPTEARAKFEEAQAELDALKAEFESIRDNPANTGTFLRWAGSAMVLIGAFGAMMFQGS